ncbi:CRISPR-associated endonuclease Cas3'' [Streptomyces sp. NPDC101776]|uniref:CRISPR-associated endonuclease Cas3'' n=1 Tax=Streptomyces sp. NPDC101776 TaxID=3366146 RepID=UPI003801B326
MGVREDARRGGIDMTPWGKFDRGRGAVYALLFHLLDVAAIAGVVWDRYLTRSQRRLIAAGLGLSLDEARCLVMFIAGLHDLGKLSAFQGQEAVPWAQVSDTLRGDARGWKRMPHERASMHSALHLLAEAGYPVDTSDSVGVLVAQILGGHHGRFLQVDIDGAARASRVGVTLGGPAWRDLRRRYFALLRHLTGATAVPADVSVPAAVLITGVGVIADRLASQGHYWLPKAQAPAFGAADHYAQAVREAPGVLEQSGLTRITLPHTSFSRAHGGLETPNALQASVIGQLAPVVGEKGAGIVVVTDATGGGKSVTALEAARIFNACGDTAGILWLLPTMATTDAAYDVLEAYVAAHRPGHAPVSVVHSHSYRNAAYTDHRLAAHEPSTSDAFWPGDDGDGGDGGVPAGERPEEKVTVPDGWLRGWDRALLAQFTVATHDQALMAVLPVRFSALRMLALSGRTVIVDEVHALPPFMRLMLGRLLHWLGALGCPVVLLSATLPQHVSRELVRSYLDGAGHPYSETAALDCQPPYPGWLYAAAFDASLTRISPAAAAAHAERHRRRADIRLHPVHHPSCTDPEDAPPRETRLERTAQEIAPVAESGGCAAVYCATVADAQATYEHLRTALDWPDGGPEGQLVLLHARLPGDQGEALNRHVRTVLSRGGRRPRRLVVVTTSLLDMSLDIDVDVMVSDLAALHTLLQRLGRLWRFDSVARPAWMRGHPRPRLSVLQPTDHHGRTLLPPAWRALDSPFLPLATAEYLAHRHQGPLTLPDDIQHLVQSVHGDAEDLATASAALRRSHTLHLARRRTEEHHSALHLVPAWHETLSLSDLHRQNLHAREAATRLGVMPRRLLPVYRTSGGRLTLDAAGTRPLPRQRKPTTAQTRTILRHTLPVPAAWVPGRSLRNQVPASWRTHALLADLVLLVQDADNPAQPVRFGRHLLHLDATLGLVHTRE